MTINIKSILIRILKYKMTGKVRVIIMEDNKEASGEKLADI